MMTIQQIEAIPANENGVIEIELEGRQRKFVKDKFIAWVSKNNIVIPAPKKPRKQRATSVRRKYTKRDQQPPRAKKYERLVSTPRKGFKVTAHKGNKTYGPFISMAAAEKELSVTKSQIGKCLKSGNKCKGFTFKKIV